MPAYMRKLWQSGLCPFLVPAAFYEEQGCLRRILDPEGLISVRTYAVLCPDGIEGSFCALLEMLASAADSFLQLQSWLADPAYISLQAQDLFYDAGRKRCVLVFCDEAGSGSFSERFCRLCSSLGGSGDMIASRLYDFCTKQIAEEKRISAFLRNWRREIQAGY